jgi:hypothetical protein
MNTRSLLLSGSILVAMTALPSLSQAQFFEFSIPEDGYINEGYISGLGATGSVTFSGNQLFVSVTNGDSGSTDFNSINSHLTKFFLLMPMVAGSKVSVTSLDSSPSGWTMANDLNAGGAGPVGNILGISNTGDYSGATAGNPNNGIDQTDTAYFSFTLDADTTSVDWDAYFAAGDYGDSLDNGETPHVAIRWQSIGITGDGGSAAGYGRFTPVPEPSQIAALSIVGLGALLMIRRRIKAKRAAKA